MFTNPVTSSFCHSLRIYYHQALWSEEIQIKKRKNPDSENSQCKGRDHGEVDEENTGRHWGASSGAGLNATSASRTPSLMGPGVSSVFLSRCRYRAWGTHVRSVLAVLPQEMDSFLGFVSV